MDALDTDAPASIDDVRRGVADLATSEALDKESALAVTRLFHAMEMLLRQACTDRDMRVAEKDAELHRLRLELELERTTAQAVQRRDAEATPRVKGSRWSS